MGRIRAVSGLVLLAALQALGGAPQAAAAWPAAAAHRGVLVGPAVPAYGAAVGDAAASSPAHRGPLRRVRFPDAGLVHTARAATGQEAAPAADAWLGPDKAKHFFLSFAATSMAHGALRAAGLDGRAALAGAAGAAIAAGAWKELRDRRVPGETASVRDAVWDLLGVAAGVALLSGV
ncbi:MAG TPA: hypothetical protein VMK65_02550 [Longimicrobiales bacterium]|nr:hypothetical protein [Longimicrobiales bacterium]